MSDMSNHFTESIEKEIQRLTISDIFLQGRLRYVDQERFYSGLKPEKSFCYLL